MSRANKIVVGWLAFTFVLGHFVMIILYALPTNYTPGNVRNIAYAYVHPVFEQSWSLFAPCPLDEQQMKITYLFEDGTSAVLDVAADEAEKHNIFRGTHHGDLVLGESNLLYKISADIYDLGLSIYEPFPADSAEAYVNSYYGSYGLTRRFAYANAIKYFDKEPVSAAIECSFENVKTGEAGILQLPTQEWKK